MTTGANEDGFHLRNVSIERDIKVTNWADLRTVQAGEPCKRCDKPLKVQRAIEVGHVFKLGTKYSVVLGALFLAELTSALADALGKLRPGHTVESDFGPGPAFAANLGGEGLKLFGGKTHEQVAIGEIARAVIGFGEEIADDSAGGGLVAVQAHKPSKLVGLGNVGLHHLRLEPFGRPRPIGGVEERFLLCGMIVDNGQGRELIERCFFALQCLHEAWADACQLEAAGDMHRRHAEACGDRFWTFSGINEALESVQLLMHRKLGAHQILRKRKLGGVVAGDDAAGNRRILLDVASLGQEPQCAQAASASDNAELAVPRVAHDERL